MKKVLCMVLALLMSLLAVGTASAELGRQALRGHGNCGVQLV